MKFIHSLMLISLLLFMSACTATGTRIQKDNLDKIVTNQTTEAEVVALFGQPDSMNLSPGVKTLIYSYQSNNSTGRSIATSTGSIVGGLVAGPIGSVAGGLAGGATVGSSSAYERLIVTIDKATGTVSNYEFQQSL